MEQLIKKNDEFVVDIIDYGKDGEGIAKIKGYTIFVVGGIKGEKCRIHIIKVNSSYAVAKVIEIINESKNRAIIDCKTYPRCGGCSLRHINYIETLEIKKEKVQNLVNKMLKEDIKVRNTIGMDAPFYYRNKAIFPINQNKQVGIFASKSHDIIPIEECKIQTKKSQEIAKYITDNWNGSIYNEKFKKGLLRNIMIREGFATNEIMCVIVQNGIDNIIEDKSLKDTSNCYINEKCFNVKKLVEKFPEIKSVVVNVNEKDTNVVLSNKNIVVYGNGSIEDLLGEFRFKISPNSFYQVNSIQTEKIYKLAIEKAKLNKNDILCDLYCGIGTIGIFASKYVKKVYGIEIIPQAIKNANENAKINNVKNIEFIEGDVEVAFDKLLKQNIRPNAIIVDPPRKGLDNLTIKNLCELKLEKLVYVSCNPATLMRDLQKLSEVYKIGEIVPIDNFCYSGHVECVAVLNLK